MADGVACGDIAALPELLRDDIDDDDDDDINDDDIDDGRMQEKSDSQIITYPTSLSDRTRGSPTQLSVLLAHTSYWRALSVVTRAASFSAAPRRAFRLRPCNSPGRTRIDFFLRKRG